MDVDEKATFLLEWDAEVSRIGGRSGTALNAAAAQLKVEVANYILDRWKESDVNIAAGQCGSSFQEL